MCSKCVMNCHHSKTSLIPFSYWITKCWTFDKHLHVRTIVFPVDCILVDDLCWHDQQYVLKLMKSLQLLPQLRPFHTGRMWIIPQNIFLNCWLDVSIFPQNANISLLNQPFFQILSDFSLTGVAFDSNIYYVSYLSHVRCVWGTTYHSVINLRKAFSCVSFSVPKHDLVLEVEDLA